MSMLKSLAFKIFNRLPDRLVLPPMYFQALDSIEMCRRHPEKIAEFQTGRLIWLLQEALTYVPYYQERYPMPVKWDESTAWDLYSSMPYLEKSQIMEDPARFVSERWQLKNLTMGSSGGSTGQVIRLYTNFCQRVVERAFFDHRWHQVAGWKRYSQTARIGCNAIKKLDQDPFSRLGDKFMISPYHINTQWLPEIMRQIDLQKIEYFHTYPSCMEDLADYFIAQHYINPRIKGVFLASEHITPRVLSLLPQVFPNAEIDFHYGLSERSNLAWGIFKNNQFSYQLEPAYGLSENLIHADGCCEIIGTNLWNNVMPFIKYCTQDFGKINNGTIERLDGRIQEFLITKQGEKIPAILENIAKFAWDQVKYYQLVQNIPGEIEIHVVPKQGQFSDEFKQRLLDDQQSQLGRYFDISIIEKTSIAKTPSGKMRMVVSNIGK